MKSNLTGKGISFSNEELEFLNEKGAKHILHIKNKTTLKDWQPEAGSYYLGPDLSILPITDETPPEIIECGNSYVHYEQAAAARQEYRKLWLINAWCMQNTEPPKKTSDYWRWHCNYYKEPVDAGSCLARPLGLIPLSEEKLTLLYQLVRHGHIKGI